MAGSKPAAFGYGAFPAMRVKQGSEREAWVIQNQAALNIAGTMPYTEQHAPVAAAGTELRYVTHNGALYRLESAFTAPEAGQFEITQDVLGATPTERRDQMKYIDTKIGFFTKSDKQMRLEGFNPVVREAKLAEHRIKDGRSGSRDFGFDLDRELYNGLTSIHNMGLTAIQKRDITNNLRASINILGAALYGARNTITFVGSSLLFAVNLVTQAVDAAFIDPDHPVVLAAPLPAPAPAGGTLMWQQTYIGLGVANPTWANYSAKYMTSFYNGLLNLWTYIMTIDLRNPIPRPVMANMNAYNAGLPGAFPAPLPPLP